MKWTTAPCRNPNQASAHCVAVAVRDPIAVCPDAVHAGLAMAETLKPGYEHWRECVAVNPAFPPSMMDFFLRGQTTCLPGHERLTESMPPDVAEYLTVAEEDLEANARQCHLQLCHPCSHVLRVRQLLWTVLGRLSKWPSRSMGSCTV